MTGEVIVQGARAGNGGGYDGPEKERHRDQHHAADTVDAKRSGYQGLRHLHLGQKRKEQRRKPLEHVICEKSGDEPDQQHQRFEWRWSINVFPSPSCTKREQCGKCSEEQDVYLVKKHAGTEEEHVAGGDEYDVDPGHVVQLAPKQWDEHGTGQAGDERGHSDEFESHERITRVHVEEDPGKDQPYEDR